MILTRENRIVGYDISQPEAPQEKWTLNLEDNVQVTGARLYHDKIYLVTSTQINNGSPCPVHIMSSTYSGKLSIPCVGIYHPTVEVPVDVTYTVNVINPTNGTVDKSVAFVGSGNESVIYMSPQAIYVTYTYFGSRLDYLYGFFTTDGQKLVSTEVLEKLKTLKNLSISDSAKEVELEVILEKYKNSLSSDESLRIENEIANRLKDYTKLHLRDLELTGIAKIGIENLDLVATGNVSGQPLNQYSLDEFAGHLRIATTITDSMLGTSETVNDVTVLDNNLKPVGKVKDLGKGERIYAVRFIENTGFVVTFKQVDPFYVLDLGNPSDPKLVGELKIPGYSAYLQQLTSNKILGVGKEGQQVKLAVFDVGNPTNPLEVDKYLLDENWTELLQNQHAFLLDSKHQVFFLPGSKGGYIFSYQNDKLQLVKAVSEMRARRALYINDYLYLVGDDKLVVVNETDWQTVNQLIF